MGLRRSRNANYVSLSTCLTKAIGFKRRLMFKEAVHYINNCQLDINSNPTLKVVYNQCVRALEEELDVKKIVKDFHTFHNANRLEEALQLIDGCVFDPTIHLNLLEAKSLVLMSMGKDVESYHIAANLCQLGYKMRRRLCVLMGDYLEANVGCEEASNFFKRMSEREHVSNDDHQYYSKLVRRLKKKEQLVKAGDKTSQATQPEPEKVLEVKEQEPDPRSNGKEKIKYLGIEEKRNDDSRDDLGYASGLSHSNKIIVKSNSMFETRTRPYKEQESDPKSKSKEKIKYPEIEEKRNDDSRDDLGYASGLSHSNKIIVKSNSIFELERLEDLILVGHRKLDIDFDLPVTLIFCTELELQNLKTLLSLNHVNILEITDLIKVNNGDVASNYFVVESVQTIGYYYALLLEKFRTEHILDGVNNEKILSKWWNSIGLQFKKIFRDLVEGLIFLSKKYVCQYDLFVTQDGTGKILPYIGRGYKFEDMIDDLVKQMKSIVYLPYLGHRFKPMWLPNDLRHLFSFLKGEKVKFVPAWWLLDHHFFWEPEEVFDFLHTLRNQHRKLGRFDYFLNEEMHKVYSKQKWSNRIPEGILKEIWNKGNPKKSDEPIDDVALRNPEKSDEPIDDVALRSAGWFKVASYRNNVDLLRYMCAVYSHYNDDEYHYKYGEYDNISEAEHLDVAGIEKQLRSLFPEFYGLLVNAIYFAVTERKYEDFSDSRKLKVLKKLSRRRD